MACSNDMLLLLLLFQVDVFCTDLFATCCYVIDIICNFAGRIWKESDGTWLLGWFWWCGFSSLRMQNNPKVDRWDGRACPVIWSQIGVIVFFLGGDAIFTQRSCVGVRNGLI